MPLEKLPKTKIIRMRNFIHPCNNHKADKDTKIGALFKNFQSLHSPHLSPCIASCKYKKFHYYFILLCLTFLPLFILVHVFSGISWWGKPTL